MTVYHDRRNDSYENVPVRGNDELLQSLKHIESRDPNGGERRPTREDHAKHRKWAVGTYGADTWKRYQAGGWDPRYHPEV